MEIDFDQGQFVARIPFDKRAVIQRAGWSWDNDIKRWVTRDHRQVGDLQVFATDSAIVELNRWRESLSARVSLSYATTSDVVIPAPPGLDYDPFQKAGILYCAQRADNLIGDPPGLGKTIQAIGLSNLIPSIRRVLVVPPAGGRINWKREWEKWCVKGLSVGIALSKTRATRKSDPVVINPKTGEPKKTVTEQFWPDTQVVVCSYEALDHFIAQSRAIEWDLLVVDEAQYIINKQAKRARNILGGRAEKKKGRAKLAPIRSRRKLALSGTPMTKYPADMWTICEWMDKKGLGSNWITYAYEYCGARQVFGRLDSSGSSNPETFQFKLRNAFMVRRDKRAVLTQLPPKRRKLVVLPNDGLAKLVEREKTANERLREALAAYESTLAPSEPEDATGAPALPWRGLRTEIAERYGHLDSLPYEERARHLTRPMTVAFEERSQARRDLAVAKLPMDIEYIQDLLSSEEKVIVFVIHTEVAEAIRDKFPGCAYITGKVAPMRRQAQVDRFQDDPECRLMVGNMDAAGVLFTMTAAHHVVMSEFDWLPAKLEQAEDRSWRRGQEHAVTIHYLAVDGSMDVEFVDLLLAREKVISDSLDKPVLSVPTPVDFLPFGA